jgi:hypothetical protein
VKNNLIDMIKITQDCLDLKKQTESSTKKSFPNINEEATRRGIYVGMLVEVCLHCYLGAYFILLVRLNGKMGIGIKVQSVGLQLKESGLHLANTETFRLLVPTK